MLERLKEAKDSLTLPQDEDTYRFGCEFSQESIDAAPPVELEEDDG